MLGESQLRVTTFYPAMGDYKQLSDTSENNAAFLAGLGRRVLQRHGWITCKILPKVYQIKLPFKPQELIAMRLKDVFIKQSESCPSPVLLLILEER